MKFQICSNGLISFKYPNTEYTPSRFPQVSAPIISPYWTDLVLDNRGQLYHRETTEPELLSKVSAASEYLVSIFVKIVFLRYKFMFIANTTLWWLLNNKLMPKKLWLFNYSKQNSLCSIKPWWLLYVVLRLHRL